MNATPIPAFFSGRTADPARISPSLALTPGIRSRRQIWTGRILSSIPVLFLTMDAAMKLFRVPAAVEGTAALGYSADILVGLGIVQLVCLALYLVPRTALVGAVLWTGYLGAAVATHVRVGHPLFSHILFPTYVAALLWGGLWLRDRRVAAMYKSTGGNDND